ncbi:MAG: hypothetical protein ACK5LL_15025, partial [Suipraeoptans sp.]
MTFADNQSLPIVTVQFISDQQKLSYTQNNYYFFLILEGKLKLQTKDEQISLKTGDIYFRSHTPDGMAYSYGGSSILVLSFSAE